MEDDDAGAGSPFNNWAPIVGRWRLDAHAATYTPPPAPEVATGLVLAPATLAAGRVNASVTFADGSGQQPNGRIVFGYDSATTAFFSAGIGGYNALYTIDQFIPGQGFAPIRTTGHPSNLEREREYGISIWLTGGWVGLEVNDVDVLQAPLPAPAQGSQVGFTAWGSDPVVLSSFSVGAQQPKAFVVMQFGEPYDTLYREVIEPVCVDEGFDATRADAVFGPGIVLNDIINEIRDATVVIAEITPVNANVFYELGYSHATEKPTILLAARGQPLPFDVQGFRCIFYDDTIGGKRSVEENLRRHLQAIS